MNPLEAIAETIGLLEKGHVVEADNTIRGALSRMALDNEHFSIMDEAAQLMYPEGKYKAALAVLQKYVEEREKHGTRT